VLRERTILLPPLARLLRARRDRFDFVNRPRIIHAVNDWTRWYTELRHDALQLVDWIDSFVREIGGIFAHAWASIDAKQEELLKILDRNSATSFTRH